jgi:hypothetical protein
MANLATVLTGRDLVDLKTNVDAFFAANLTIRVLHIGFIARQRVSTPDLDLAVSILYDLDGATLTAPYIANFLQAEGPTELGTAITTFLATVTTQFSQGPYVDYQKESRDINGYTSLIVTNVSIAQGSANWLASSAPEVMQLDVSDSIAFSVGPAAGTILGAAAPVGGFQLIVNTLLHDDTLDEGSYWKMPILNAGAGINGLTLNLKWASTTAIAGDAVWGCAIAGIAAGEVITAETHDDFQRVTTTVAGVVDTVVESTISFTNAQADVLATADYVQVLIARFGSDAADTLVGDASLIGAELVFG